LHKIRYHNATGIATKISLKENKTFWGELQRLLSFDTTGTAQKTKKFGTQTAR
jgi:hypothetical protein